MSNKDAAIFSAVADEAALGAGPSVTSALVRISWTLILSLAVLAPLVWRHIIYDLHFG